MIFRTLATSISSVFLVQAAFAGGFDRNGQPIGLIFEEGNYAEISVSRTTADLSGTDVLGTDTGNVAEDFSSFSGGLKFDISDKLSFAIIYDEPWGADIQYPTTSTILGTTGATTDSSAITSLLRYKFSDNYSVHGGIRYQSISGTTQLGGLAYGVVDGYTLNANKDSALGYVIGAAYEIPEKGVRVAITYNSEIEHELELVESLAGFGTFNTSSTTKTPQSVNLDLQSGISKNTVIFGSVRWAENSSISLIPPTLNSELIDFDDSTTYTLGVGHSFDDNWAGSISYTYEGSDGSDQVSPLAPAYGFQSLNLSLQYQKDNLKVLGGLRYTMLGDTRPTTDSPSGSAANFTDNDTLTFTLTVGHYF